MDSPGRIYLRVEDGIQTEEHRAIIDRWIADYEKNRRTFVFPEGTARGFGYFFVVVGLLLLILQVKIYLSVLKRRSHFIAYLDYLVGCTNCTHAKFTWFRNMDGVTLSRSRSSWINGCSKKN